MIWFISWLLVLELMGLAALPLAARILKPLPDRGYLFSKPLGLLLVGYLSWITAIFGLLRFQRSTIALTLVVVAAVCWGLWGKLAIKELEGKRVVLIVSEALFIFFFAAASTIRAYNPEIAGTEKPMDFAFLNAIYRSDVLPPEDPWMAGYSISYYYFGYLLLAVMAKLSAVPASVGYNLGVAVVFALLLAGSFSLGFNLITMLKPQWRTSTCIAGALLVPIMVGVMGNLEIGFEVLALRGLGDSGFWQWVGIKGISASSQPDGWIPTTHWWWWRASRVIPTIKPDGINEFPYFSFLLGDLHPHFTSLPWALLAVAISLSALANGAAKAASPIDRRLIADWPWLIFPALILGFLLVGNSWDFPSYTGLFWLASIVGAIYRASPRLDRFPAWGREDVPSHTSRFFRDWGRWWGFSIAPWKRLFMTSALSVLLYSPFFLGFSSQTKGIGISADKTPLISLMIIFGPFLAISAVFLVWQRAKSFHGLRAIDVVVLLVAATLAILSWFVGTYALIAGILVLAACEVFETTFHSEKKEKDIASAHLHESGSIAHRFILLLLLVGLSLIFVPEFIFIADLFGTRMNTVFKFHYQAWLMLGIASSVAALWLASSVHAALRWLTIAATVLLVGVGLLYPLSATPSKTNGFKASPNLDGAAFYQSFRPDDYAAIQWLSRSVGGRPVVLEAVGGEYSEYARVSTFSGLPTVIGWPGHEVQWRGQGEEAQRRSIDVDTMYKTTDNTSLIALLRRYKVEYIFVGSLEIERYGPAVTSRFEGRFEPLHREGKTVIYKVPNM